LITLGRLRNGGTRTVRRLGLSDRAPAPSWSRRIRISGTVSCGLLLAGACLASPALGGTSPASEGPAGSPALLPAGHVATAPAAHQQGVSAGCAAAPYGANFYAPAFGSGKTVALTFDDGPGPTTAGIISVLREYGVPATFFNIGQNAAAYPSLVRQEAADGYLVGNHTWNHPDLTTLSAARQAAELDEASAEQQSLIGEGPCAFRPPYGNYNATTLTLARQRGLKTWIWSVDTEDWKADGSSSSYWVNRIIHLAESEGGSQRHPLVLMHNAPSGDPATLRALPTVISYFRGHGYTFVNLAGTTGTGYYVAASNGTVHRSAAAAARRAPVGRPAGIATDPDTGGYWLLAANGGVLAHGAPFYGQLSGKLGKHVTAVAIAASRGGYLVLTSDGAVHAFGAPYHGEPKGRMGKLKPVGLAVNAATGGYWVLNSGGGVWGYGAKGYGSLAGKPYRATAIAPSPQGGYLLLTSTGKVFGFHAHTYGGAKSGLGRGVTAVSLAVASATGGYWILLSNGTVLGFHAPTHGSLAGKLPPHTTATAITGT
jgi:peptidoglycan/xylan/chitin deacetylase (PgdA/CDA1 family)